MIYQSITDLIGRTPILSLSNLLPAGSANLFVKLDGYNPGGSVKDRPALSMIVAAEAAGKLLPGGTIVESTSGNLGVALAMIAATRGYRCMIVVDPRTSPHNVAMIEALGAEVVMVTESNPADGTFQEARIRHARKLADTVPGAFMPWQYGNPDNPRAHEATTAAEILADFPDDGPDVLVAAVSTGGQISGTASGLKKRGARTKAIGVDVRGSVVFGGEKGPTAVTGMGLGWIPDNLNESVIDEAYLVETQQCFSTVRLLAKTQGLLLGGSSGAALFVAIGEAIRQGEGKSVVAIAADRGEKYLEEIYRDEWMAAKNLVTDQTAEDLISAACALTPFRFPAAEFCGRHVMDVTG